MPVVKLDADGGVRESEAAAGCHFFDAAGCRAPRVESGELGDVTASQQRGDLLGRRQRTPRRWRAVRVLVVSIGVCVAAVELRGNTTPDWPGWRGAAKAGRTTGPLPVRWSPTDGIAWQVPIPGKGHSSPIVQGDKVYVSTAYGSSGTILQRAVSQATGLFVALLAVLSMRVVMLRCPPCSRPGARQYVLASGLVFGVGVLAVVVLAGEQLLDFARCPIRSWLATSAFATVSAAVIMLAPVPGRWRLIVMAVLMAVSAAILAGVPARDHAFRGGLSSVNSRVMFAAATVPLVLAILTAISMLRSRRWRRALTAAAAVAILFTGWRFLTAVLTYREGTLPPLETLHVRVIPWVAPLMLCAIVAMVASWRMRADSRGMTYLRVILGAVTLSLGAVGILDVLAAYSPYTAYHLGNPRFVLTYPAGPAVVTISTLFCFAALYLRPRAPQSAKSTRLLLLAFTGSAALGAVLFFARYNYLHADPGTARAIVSISRTSGSVAWTAEGLVGPAELTDRRNSPATPTPVADESRVCAYFGNAGLMCADHAGRLQWSRNDVTYDSFYGAGFSPVLHNGVIVLGGETPDGRGAILGIDAATGKDLWRRNYVTSATSTGNSRTPTVHDVGDRTVVLVWGVETLRALDLKSGDEVWVRALGSSGDFVSSAVSDEESLFLSSGTGTVALSLSALGAGTGDWRRWSQPAARSNCVSPVVCGGLLVLLSDRGVVTALDRATGDIVWRHRLDGQFFASPVSTPESVYFTNTDGATTILACENAARVIAQNDIAEPVMASPAVAAGQLILRTASAVYSIGEER